MRRMLLRMLGIRPVTPSRRELREIGEDIIDGFRAGMNLQPEKRKALLRWQYRNASHAPRFGERES